MSWLEGKKTYIGIIAGVIWSLLGVFGVIDPSSEGFQATILVIAAWTGVSANVAIHKP
jgi:hypothetical protein